MSLYGWGWKDILRPIRDRLRDGWNPPKRSPSPTPEERDAQRRGDGLKGFAYLDTFDQLRDWSADSVDCLHVANTPLITRAIEGDLELKRAPKQGNADNGAIDNGKTARTISSKSRVLLCHDYSGNYHDYESLHTIGLDEEQYSCEYLQFVDLFVYFSHKLVTIPPTSWTNTLHRNGVKVLGTLIVEPQTPHFESLLEKTDTGASGKALQFRMARQLASIAETYGFDGWLINLEKPFSKEQWDLSALLGFLEHLKQDLGEDRELVWYDALTVDNEVDYQNSVTNENVAFAKAAGSILTNYRWSERKAINSLMLAQENNLHPSNIFFGIDVWAQNKQTTGPARITYPKVGGGGTNTGVGVEKLAEVGVSAGIFAPAWSHEHFPRDGRAVERAMWDGVELPDDMSCDCDDALTHRTQRYRAHPITHSAREYPAGSRTFFSTNFERAFSSHIQSEDTFYNNKKIRSQLGTQSVLPHMRPHPPSTTPTLSALILDNPARLRITFHPNKTSSETQIALFPLSKLFISSPVAIHATCTPTPGYSLGLYIRNDLDQITTLEAPTSTAFEAILPESTRTVTEIGVYILAPSVQQSKTPIPVLELRSLALIPPTAPNIATSEITDIRIIAHPSDPPQKRLKWSFTTPPLRRHESWDGMPQSATTGPFAWFEVQMDRVPMQRAFALEWIVPEQILAREGGGEKSLEVRVTGVGFDGRRSRTGFASVVV